MKSPQKSLTNLVWGNTAERGGGGSGRHSVLLAVNKEAAGPAAPPPVAAPVHHHPENGRTSNCGTYSAVAPTPQPRTASGFFHGLGMRQAPTVVKSHLQMHHSSKLGSRASKKVGTLYL